MSYIHYDIRSKIWYDERVSLKYKQSSFLFIKNKSKNYISNQILSDFPLDVVHPLLFKKIYNIKNIENLNYSALEKLNETEVELNMVANRLDRIEKSNSWKLIKKIQKIVNNNFILSFFYVLFFNKN
jgi:GTP-binding protein EngB required for normal cell division